MLRVGGYGSHGRPVMRRRPFASCWRICQPTQPRLHSCSPYPLGTARPPPSRRCAHAGRRLCAEIGSCLIGWPFFRINVLRSSKKMADDVAARSISSNLGGAVPPAHDRTRITGRPRPRAEVRHRRAGAPARALPPYRTTRRGREEYVVATSRRGGRGWRLAVGAARDAALGAGHQYTAGSSAPRSWRRWCMPSVSQMGRLRRSQAEHVALLFRRAGGDVFGYGHAERACAIRRGVIRLPWGVLGAASDGAVSHDSCRCSAMARRRKIVPLPDEVGGRVSLIGSCPAASAANVIAEPTFARANPPAVRAHAYLHHQPVSGPGDDAAGTAPLMS
jgi:hypothetical protein